MTELQDPAVRGNYHVALILRCWRAHLIRALISSRAATARVADDRIRPPAWASADDWFGDVGGVQSHHGRVSGVL